jgi:tetratricopeptide (TPR) repeat protein
MFEKALSIDPDYEYARYRKAGIYAQTKRYDQAIAELKELLYQNPAYYDAMQLMGDVYYNRNSYSEALRWYEGAYTNGVRNRWICHLMAYLYDQKNEIPKAVPLYKEALYYDSTNTDVYVRLGELLQGKDGDFFRTRARQLGQQ